MSGHANAKQSASDTVVLNWHEAAMASDVGRMRQLASVKSGRSDRHGYSGDGWSEHIEGACGECATAKHLGVYWDGGVNTFSSPDVGKYHVRTRSRHDYELIVRPESDKDEDIFICVTGRCPEYRIRGWIAAKDAKKPEYLREHGGRPPAFFVPHSALRPMSELPVNG